MSTSRDSDQTHADNRSMDKRLRDYVRFGTITEIERALSWSIASIDAVQAWLQKHVARDSNRVIASNILALLKDYIRLVRPQEDFPLPALAFSTRSIYELDLRLRSILRSSEEQGAWQAEAALDKIAVLEALVELSTPDSERLAETLKQEIDRLKTLIEKYELPDDAKPPRYADLAAASGLQDEHRALYKLFSKLVHPSSWLANDITSTRSPQIRNILLTHLQLYAADTLQRIMENFGVPDDAIPHFKRYPNGRD